MSILSIGVSGLNAANIALSTASHNIANASTPGYNRQTIVQGTNLPMMTGAGFIGQGTNVETVKRVYSQFLSQQVLTAQTGASAMDSYLQQIQQIDNLFGDATAGLSPALTAFFQGVQQVAANPSSIPARQSMLSSAQALVSRFQSLDQRLSEIRDGVNGQIGSEVQQINSYATQIADINRRILLARAGGLNQEPNDLLDQRDQMIADLNKSVGVSTVTQDDGSINVFIGNGQPLVVGQQAYSLVAQPAASDPGRMAVAMVTPGGNVELPESQLVGGTLGGLVAFRSQSLDSAQNSLGQIAIALAQDFNDQHRLGVDLTGAFGTDFFNYSAPATRSNSLNTGSGVLTAGFTATASADLTSSDYRLSYDGTTYTLTRLADNQAWTGASAAAVATTAGQGFDLALAGTPNAGDSFLIQPTRGGAGSLGVAITDARNIAAAAPIVTSTPTTNTGTSTIDAGSVTSVASLPLGTPMTLTYSSAGTGSFSGFPVGSTVVVTSGGTPTSYSITSSTDPVAYVSGATISFNGMTVTISGAPANGDQFLISDSKYGTADNRNANLLAALQSSKTMLGESSSGTAPTASFADAYAQIVSAVGNKTSEVTTIGQSQQGLADAAETARQQVSGVNLDEEAANLIRYQQAYQASAKVIGIAGKLFDDLLAIM